MSTHSGKNVVDMGKFDRLRATSGASGVPLLNDCRDMAATQLAQAAGVMLDKGANDLFEQAEKALGAEMRNLYMEAMSLARDSKESIQNSFKRQFTQNCNKHLRKGKGAPTSSQNSLDISGMELSLVDPDELEESLASVNIANNIHGTCAEELFGIEQRLGTLLHVPQLDASDNPIGPETIGNAFMEGLKELDCPVKVKLLLVMLFNKYMPDQIKSMYQSINQHLVSKGVLPKIRIGVKKQGADSSRSSVLPASGTNLQEAATNGQELFATLQQLLSLGSAAAGMGQGGPMGAMGFAGMGGGASAGGMGIPAGMASGMQNAGVISALNKLQHGEMEALLGEGSTFDPAALSAGHINVLREIKSSSVAGVMGHVDAMTLDIVAMLFDYILDDRNIPDAMKALIGRLQIPVLKVAMLDKSFFSQKSHPARKFLDTLADAAIGWNEEEGHEGGLYQKVDDLVQSILNEFDDKVGIFTAAQEDLENFLADEKQHADALTGRSAQVVHSREQAEIAKIVTYDEVRRRLENARLPQVIRDFLANEWSTVLKTTYQNTGEDSPAWTEALQTMDDLMWSVATKQAAEERKKLVSMLPSLLKRLQQGMETINITSTDRDQFFAKLIRCHADAVKSGLNSGSIEALLETPAADSASVEVMAQPQAELDVDALHAELQADFEEIFPTLEAPAADPSLIQQISEEPASTDLSLEEIPLGNGPWQSPQAENDDFEAMVGHIKRGTWVEFTQEDGSTSRSKLAWVSPMKGLLLFTNRLGSRALSITPAALAEKFRNGQAQIINDSALVDRAVSDLMERLHQNVAVA